MHINQEMGGESRIYIIGLGNGSSYVMSRHNIGMDIINSLVKNKSLEVIKKDNLNISREDNFYYITGEGFINNSYATFKTILDNLNKEDVLLVVCDDAQLELYNTEFTNKNAKFSRHNGVKSLYNNLNTNFFRYKIGIGHKKPLNKHVLGKFDEGEFEDVKNNAISDFTNLLERYKLFVKSQC